MADGVVQVRPDSTGKKIDVEELTVGANTVERQRVQVAGAAAAEVAAVKALADAMSNPAGLMVGACLLVWNGSTWDRMTPAATEGTLAKLAIAQGSALGSNVGPMVLGAVKTTPPSYATGTIQPLSIDPAGNLRCIVLNPQGHVIQGGNVAHDAATVYNPLTIGGYASAAAPADVSADADVVRAWFLRNGAQAAVITAAGALIGGDATNGLDVDVTRLPGIAGDVAHDAADSGNPVKIGGKALDHGANPAAVAANERTQFYANRHGIPWSIGGHPNIKTKEFHFTAVQTDAALVAVNAGTKICVTMIDAMLAGSGTVKAGVRIGFAAATIGTVSSSGVAGIVLSHGKLAAGSGVVKGNGGAVIGIGADGEDLRITSEVPSGGSLRVIVTWFEIEG